MREQRWCRHCAKYKFADAGIEFEHEGRQRWLCGACVASVLKGPKRPTRRRTLTKAEVDNHAAFIKQKEES